MSPAAGWSPEKSGLLSVTTPAVWVQSERQDKFTSSTIFSLSGKATFIQTFIAFRFGCVLSPGVASYSFMACQNTLEERFNVEFIALWSSLSFKETRLQKKSSIKSRHNVPFSFRQVIKSQIHKIHNMLKMKPCIQIILCSVIIAVHV